MSKKGTDGTNYTSVIELNPNRQKNGYIDLSQQTVLLYTPPKLLPPNMNGPNRQTLHPPPPTTTLFSDYICFEEKGRVCIYRRGAGEGT